MKLSFNGECVGRKTKKEDKRIFETDNENNINTVR